MSISMTPEQRIRNRVVWFVLSLIGVGFTAVVIALFTGRLVIGVVDIEFGELLSLAIALFAIGLSFAFYSKANDSASKFYDNSHKFTQDVSVILGRMEERFGERLRSLDEGQSRIIDRALFSGSEIQSTEQELEEDRGTLNAKLEERDAVIATLVDDLELNESQRQELASELASKSEEIAQMRQHVENMENRLSLDRAFQGLSTESMSLLKLYAKNESIAELVAVGEKDSVIRSVFSALPLTKRQRSELESLGIIDSESNHLTKRGLDLVKALLEGT